MKTVLVTGATSGFGKGLVTALLEKGYNVVATGRSLIGRQDVFAHEREKYKTQLVELDLDVTSAADMKAIEEYFRQRPLDVLINNAGFAIFGPVEECSEEKLRKQFEVNVFGVFLLTQKLLPALRHAKGHIINFSSAFGLMGFPLSSAYCATKFAIEGFSESLSYELKPFSVKVSLIEPGGYRTNFNNAAEWGMELSTNSVYSRQVKNYTRLRQNLATRPNPQRPEEVVQGVIKIIQTNNPKINYSFGKDAFLVRFMKKIMPRSLFHRISGKALYSQFNKEH
ncbi:MAG: SDR family oxidoreductase [Bdellovibrionaceae bacterium]|nr:SDR family oxidoreductase [Pseudobdellovibrionaceae bacterium]